MLLDKGLLALLGLLFAFLLSRKLEAYKVDRALEGEYVRERTKRLDEVFGMMLEVEAEATRFARLAAKYVEDRKAPSGFLSVTKPHPEIDESREKYRQLSVALQRRAERVRPWIGDSVAQLCAEHEKLVERGVQEQTFPGAPRDWELIEELQAKAALVREQIVAAIREGAPPATTKKTSA